MNNLCADVGYQSLNKQGEQLCGDHIDRVDTEDGTVLVLADGLGSGVKASILSTLTARIISTMVAAGLPLSECVRTIAATLPVCKERGVAYATFTILHLKNNETAELIQYDNPRAILLRNGVNEEYASEETIIGDKKISCSVIPLRENDLFVLMSDGCIHAGIGMAFNFGWERKDIIPFLEAQEGAGYTAKTLTTMLLSECDRLYGGKPGDDTTVMTVRVRKRVPMNLMFGPSRERDDQARMISLFFSKAGKHIVCGGTTGSAVARALNKPLIPSLDFPDPKIPPIASIEGVDLVTEGVITVNRVLEYAQDYLRDNALFGEWSSGKDGASLIARLLFEEATDISFFVGRAINPAHQNPNLPINFNIKMQLVDGLSQCLRQMGKRVTVVYF